MSEQKTRRQLMQQAVFAAGAAAVVTNKLSAQAEDQSAWKKFFPEGFRNERIKTSGAEINTLIGGSGPPVLLFHGAPDSLITWRMIAPDLAKDYTLVLCDLRGYGDSSNPPTSPIIPSSPSGPWRSTVLRSWNTWASASSAWSGTTAAGASDVAWRSIIRTVC